jgi:UDP-glucose 4-epimerase
VLVTGVSRFWGCELAQRLEADPEVEQIVGVDIREPSRDLSRTDFAPTSATA